MADKKDKSGKSLFGGIGDKIGGLFGGRTWILFVLIGFVVLVLVLVLVVALSGKGGSRRRTATVTPGMLTAGIVTGDDRYAYYDETGKLVGVEPDLAAALAEAEGLTLKVVEAATPQEVLSLLDTGAIDVAYGRLSSDMVRGGYSISTEYSRCGLFLVTRLHDYTDSLDLMTGYSVGVMSTVAQTAESINNYTFITPKEYADAVKLGQDVRDKAINMGICNERDALFLVKSFPNALQTQQISGGPAEHYVAVFPSRQDAHTAVMNAVISNME